MYIKKGAPRLCVFFWILRETETKNEIEELKKKKETEPLRNKKKKRKKKKKEKRKKEKKNASASWVEVAQRTGEPRRARFRGVVERGDARRVGRAGDDTNEEERREGARALLRACASRKGPRFPRLSFFHFKNFFFIFFPFCFFFRTRLRWSGDGPGW